MAKLEFELRRLGNLTILQSSSLSALFHIREHCAIWPSLAQPEQEYNINTWQMLAIPFI